MSQDDLVESLQATVDAFADGRMRRAILPRGAEDIKAMRTGLGHTQAEFAEFIGVSLDTVKSWEAGRRHPGALAQAAMGRALARNSNPARAES